MKNKLLIGALTLLTISITNPVVAENLSDLRKLLSTKECRNCDLTGSGLVMANLSGAKLSGVNFSGANLSRADLSGANLIGADLSGASLYGANLSGANLIGANLNGTDLRNAYLHNAVLVGVSFDTAYLQGATGIPNYAGTPEQFVRWGMVEASKGQYHRALEHYNKALSINSQFSYAYLNRGIARYRLGDESGATQDAEIAGKIFEAEDNTLGIEASQKFLEGIEMVNQIEENQHQNRESKVERFLGGIGSLLLKLFL